MRRTILSPLDREMPFTLRAALLASLLCATGAAWAQAAPAAARKPLIVAPSLGVKDLLLCDEAVANRRITRLADAFAMCQRRKLDGAPALTRLLDTLEPGGPKGQVQVGYTLTLQLLGLYRRTPQGWAIDTDRLDTYLRVIRKVDRPVVVYLSADHFDSQGPLPAELAKDPRNLMHLAGGKPLKLGYFGYSIIPYTLSPDPAIPVNRYRFEALQAVARRILALPPKVQARIVAYTLVGELHQMFPDFENGTGAYQDIQVTDYSPASVAGFRQWLQRQYGSIASFNARHGFDYAAFDAVPAPARDIRKDKLGSFGEHYDAFADGTLPIAGWLWDPRQVIEQLDLYVDGRRVGPVARGLNRLDVYRAVAEVTTPNTGFRHDLDFSQLPPGRHRAQVVAQSRGAAYQLAEVEFVVVPRDQGRVPDAKPAGRTHLKSARELAGVRAWLDMPRAQQDVYYNPLARDWNRYRQEQVYDFLKAFHARALQAGLPADKLYSHQIVPAVNASWNPQLLAVDSTLQGSTPWKQGLNMYGGATDSAWLRAFMAGRGIRDYGAPEFNPQQWKRPGAALAALQSHYDGGARFISPYYFSLIPDRFKGSAEHGVNRMELGPKNTQDGSDQLYRALVEFAKR